MNAAVIDSRFADELVADVERRTAADKFMTARRIKDLAPSMNDQERAKHVDVWRAMVRELEAAILYAQRWSPRTDDVPALICIGSTLPPIRPRFK